MGKKKTKDAPVPNRHRGIRLAIARSIEMDLGMGCFDDACEVVTLSERHYVTAVVEDIIRKLKEA